MRYLLLAMTLTVALSPLAQAQYPKDQYGLYDSYPQSVPGGSYAPQGYYSQQAPVYAPASSYGQFGNGGYPQSGYPQQNAMRPLGMRMTNWSQGGASGPNLLKMLLNGQQAQPVQPAPAAQTQNQFTPQSLLRTFFGESPTSSGFGGGNGGGDDSQARGNAHSNLQTALDQAAQAESACSRASYGQRDYRQSAASEAQNHANAARAAADRATSAAGGHSMPANDYAAQARNAANRAQAAADRAAYNASIGN